MTTDEMLAVITAYKEGKFIEVRDAYLNTSPPGEINIDDEPNYRFDFEHERYAILETKFEYRPYETVEEFFEDYRRYGCICYKRNEQSKVTIHVSPNGRCCIPGDRVYSKEEWEGKTFSFSYLFDNFMYTNKKPCGKMVKYTHEI